jgi:ribosomal protein S18 acetylase RimI-like enzyme
MKIQRVQPDEYASLGEITVRAYRQLFGGDSLGTYEDELLDVGRRNTDSDVYVAVGDDGSLLGGVTYVPGPGRTMSEFSDSDAAGIRMLAVDPRFQGSGVGRALTAWCIERARSQHRKRVVLHSTPAMTVAHGMYEGLGFLRSPELDEWVKDSPDAVEPLHLLSFTYEC